MAERRQQGIAEKEAQHSILQDWLRRHRRPTIIATAVVAAIFAVAIVYAYREGQRALSAEPPLVRAPTGPVRIKPDDPGGMTVPDRDKLVYNRVSGEGEDAAVRLRPGPELPIERPLPTPAPALDTKPAVEDEPEAPPVAADEQEKTAVEVVPAKVTPPSPPTLPTPPTEAVYVQLGALGSQAAAELAWDRLSQIYPELKAAKRVVSPLRKDDGVVLYRLQAGPLAGKAAADKLCAALRSGGQGCFLVKP